MENEVGNKIVSWFSQEDARFASIDHTIMINIKFFEFMNGETGQKLASSFLGQNADRDQAHLH